ncbi:MAG: hypothetical protein ACK5UE_10605 [Chitinophagales bacterium]|jgi:hypothetical protein|nr:hypothetical protein [Sphingobacteriales bacterium]
MKTYQLSSLLLLFFVYSCSITEHIPNKYMVSKVSEVPCDTVIDSPLTFFTYLQGEKIDFEYTPISLMTFSNGNKGLHTDILFEMKESARKQCADGIINLSQDIAEGKYKVEENFNFDNNRNNDISYFTYNIRKFTGTAVKLKNKDELKLRIDSLYLKQKQFLLEQARQDSINKIAMEKLNPEQTKNPFGWIMAGLFGVFLSLMIAGLVSK